MKLLTSRAWICDETKEHLDMAHVPTIFCGTMIVKKLILALQGCLAHKKQQSPTPSSLQNNHARDPMVVLV